MIAYGIDNMIRKEFRGPGVSFFYFNSVLTGTAFNVAFRLRYSLRVNHNDKRKHCDDQIDMK